MQCVYKCMLYIQFLVTVNISIITTVIYPWRNALEECLKPTVGL